MDIILYNIVVALSCIFIGYLFGSIPTGIFVGKVIYNQDPRLAGSKNSGGTNVGRLFGKKAGLFVIIMDMFKVIIPVICVWLVFEFSGIKQLFIESGGSLYNDGLFYVYLTGLGATIGHCWSVFAKFKGGKTVAVFCGFVIGTCWFLTILGVITFFVTLKIKKYVSLASIMTAIVATIGSWILYAMTFCVSPDIINIAMWGWGGFALVGWQYSLVLTIISMILIYKHKANIQRLKNHQESKIKWLK